MTPLADDRSGERAGEESSGVQTFDCPACRGTLRRSELSLRCRSCGHTPRHGAD